MSLSILNKFARDYYRRHGIDFTKTGWMQGKEFVGGDATYPFALQSHGPCTPETKYYGVRAPMVYQKI